VNVAPPKVPVVGVESTPGGSIQGVDPRAEPKVSAIPVREATPVLGGLAAAPPRSRSGSQAAPPAGPPARSLRDRLPAGLGLHVPHGRELREPDAHVDRAVVVIHDVTKTYPNGKMALRDVDLIVPEGDFVFLVGPSGAGKSTLIKLLIRDELASQGEVVLDGEDLARLARRHVARVRRKIGTVFQDFKLLPTKSAWENVAFALEVTGTSRRLIPPAVDRVLALVGLSAQAQQVPSQLSGGEQQRTAIARALVHDPRIIIADEPTGNLDPLISWEIIQLLLRINELGVTVFMATHNAEVVTALRKRVVALEEGRIIRDEVGGAYHRED
jgi:cell division transport system ATP-binding protein